MIDIALMKRCICGKRIDYNIVMCDECMAEDKARVQRYDRRVRHSEDNKRYVQFYNSKTWRTLSEVIKSNFNGVCPICLIEDNEVVDSDTTHHISELKEDWELRLIGDNLIPLCHSCHNNIHVNYCEEDKLYLKNIIKKYKNKFGDES